MRATVITARAVLVVFLLGSLWLWIDLVVLGRGICMDAGDPGCALLFSRKEAALTMGLWVVVLSGLISLVALARLVPERSRFSVLTAAVTAAAALGLFVALTEFG